MLDERSFLVQNDPMGMSDLTAGFADQCARAVEIAQAAALPKWTALPDHVILTGLGGSAAGGDLLAALFANEGKVPFLVNRDYTLPSFAGQGTLVICASYSGNTEETISAYHDARRRGCTILVLSSGGELTKLAKQDGWPVITVPGGQPPRTAMGYMFMPLVVACAQMGLIPPQDFEAAINAIREVATECGFESPETVNPAKQLSRQMSGKLATLYGLGSWQYALSQRWRGQINENSKEMILTHVFPELCHNEILGWQGSDEQGVAEWITVLFAGGDESDRFMARVRITCEQIGTATSFITVTAKGDRLLAKMLSLAHFGDYVSLYLAALKGRDPGQMIAIDRLKEELAKLP